VIVYCLAERGVDFNAQGGHYGNTLQAAVFTGKEDMVRYLVEQRADVNAQGGHYGNALQAAVFTVEPGYGVDLFEDDYLLLLPPADLRMDPAEAPSNRFGCVRLPR
jgi:hypothetical protein